MYGKTTLPIIVNASYLCHGFVKGIILLDFTFNSLRVHNMQTNLNNKKNEERKEEEKKFEEYHRVLYVL